MITPSNPSRPMSEGRYFELFQDLSGVIPGERLIRDDLRTLAYGTDASFYRLIPKLVVRVDTEAEVEGSPEAVQRPPASTHLPRGWDQPVGTVPERLGAHAVGHGMAGNSGRGPGEAHHPAARRGGRPRQCPAGSLPEEDRARPRLHQCRHGRGNRRQQRQRNVLRHLPKQLSDPGRHENHPCRRHPVGHPQFRQQGWVPPDPSGPGGAHWAPGGADPREQGTGRSDSPQVQNEEYHRLQPERPDRF